MNKLPKPDWNTIGQAKKHKLQDNMTRVHEALANTAEADRFEVELNNWADWPGFLRDGGVPGCRISEMATTREIAEMLATGGIDGYDGQPVVVLNRKPFRHIYDVEDMRNEAAAYSPDY